MDHIGIDVHKRESQIYILDRLSNRTGYGRIAPDGRVDLYGLDGRRTLHSTERIGRDGMDRGAGRC